MRQMNRHGASSLIRLEYYFLKMQIDSGKTRKSKRFVMDDKKDDELTRHSGNLLSTWKPIPILL